MTALLRNLKARADLMILDTPHMGPFTDAVVLSPRASGTLLVIRAGSTRRTVLTNTLRKVGGAVVGTVLNMTDMKLSTKHSSYDYQPYISAFAEAVTGGGTRGT